MKTKPVRLTVVTANIGRKGATLGRVKATFAAIRRRFGRALIGWQEIDEADEADEHGTLKTYLVNAKGRIVWRAVGWATATPVTIPRGWKVVRSRITVTCGGRAGLTPHRVCVQVLIEHRRTGYRVIAANGHYPRGIPKLADLWSECHTSWREVVEYWRPSGYSMLLTRDRNRGGSGYSLHATEQQLLPPDLIDKVSFIPGTDPAKAVGIRVESRDAVDPGIDGHKARGVRLTILAPPDFPVKDLP